MSDWNSEPEAKPPVHTHANTEAEQSTNANFANQPSSSKKPPTKPPLPPNPIAPIGSTHLVVGPGRTSAIMNQKRRPSVQKYPLRSSAANMTTATMISKTQTASQAPTPSTRTLPFPTPRARALPIPVWDNESIKSAAHLAPRKGPSIQKTLCSTASTSTAAAVVGAPSPAAAAAARARVRARNGGSNRSHGVQFSGLRARDRNQDRDSDNANADTDIDGDSPPSPGRSASRMMAAARVRYLNAASDRFGARFHFNKTPAKEKVLQAKPMATQRSFKKLVPSPRREKRQGERDDKYYVPTPYKFHVTESSQSLLQGSPLQPSVTIQYKNPKSLSAFKSEMEAVYDNDPDREKDTITLGSSTVSVFKAQDSREDFKSKKIETKAKDSTTTKDKDMDELLKSKAKPLAKPVKSMKSDSPTALRLGSKPDLSSESEIEIVHNDDRGSKRWDKAARYLNVDSDGFSARLHFNKVAQAPPPTATSADYDINTDTEFTSTVESTRPGSVEDRFAKRLRVQPDAVLEALRIRESLPEILVSDLLKRCDRSMYHDYWLNAGLVGKVRELDTELEKRLEIKDNDNTPKAAGAEGAGREELEEHSADVVELDTKIEASTQELKGRVAEADAPTTKDKRMNLTNLREALQAKIDDTEAALADLEANARDRVEKRLRIQPVAVLGELRTSESLQDNAYLQETLVHFFELLKLCEGSMHEDWFDAGFMGKVKELDLELGKRLGIKDKDNTPKAVGAEGAGEDRELKMEELAEPTGCHSAVGNRQVRSKIELPSKMSRVGTQLRNLYRRVTSSFQRTNSNGTTARAGAPSTPESPPDPTLPK